MRSFIRTNLTNATSSIVTGRSFYFNSLYSGSTTNGAISTPYKSTSQFSFSSNLRPGDTVYFNRGASYKGATDKAINLFNLTGSANAPITFTAYGTGSNPVILFGPSTSSTPDNRVICYLYKCNYIVIDGLTFTDLTMDPSDHTIDGKVGYAIFNDMANDHINWGHHNIIRNCSMSLIGMGVECQGDYNLIEYNDIGNLRSCLNTPIITSSTDDYGANGVVIAGSNNIIRFNNIYDLYYKSYDFNWDGGAFELFAITGGCYNNYIYGNVTRNCVGFLEMGTLTAGATASNNVFAYNTMIDSGHACMFHNGGQFTLISKDVRFYNNTIINNSKPFYVGDSDIFLISGGTNELPQSGALAFKNNIIYMNNVSMSVIRSSTYTFSASQVAHSNNLIILGSTGSIGGMSGSTHNFILSATDITASLSSVIFSDTTSTNAASWSLFPASSSLIINQGTDIGFLRDLQNAPILGLPDIGAYEYNTSMLF